MATGTLVQQITAGGETLTNAIGATDDALVFQDILVGTTVTDLESTVSVNKADISMLYILAPDTTITMEVNDGAGAGGTVVLVADTPFIWTTDSYATLTEMGITADITALFFTNASGSIISTVKIRIIHDASQDA